MGFVFGIKIPRREVKSKLLIYTGFEAPFDNHKYKRQLFFSSFFLSPVVSRIQKLRKSRRFCDGSFPPSNILFDIFTDLEFGDDSLETGDLLIVGVLGGVVGDKLDARGVCQGYDRLVGIVVSGRNIDEHQRLRVPA